MVQRYNAFAIILHWVMAVAFVAMLASGLIMGGDDLDPSLKFKLYQWHKSGGVLLLLAFFLRFGWRIFSAVMKQIPPLPAHLPKLEQLAAKLGHIALYVWMILTPLAGWLVVSSSSYGIPTIVFDLFEWPHVPGVQANKAVHDVAEQAHELLAYSFIVIIVGHIAAVVKHAIFDKENLLTRMWFK